MFRKNIKIARLLLIAAIFPILVLSCTNEDDDNSVASTAASNVRTITDFSFTAASNTALSADVTATISGTDITVTVLSGTNVTALIATFTTSGNSVSVGSTKQVSGTTVNDFSSAVTYTVTDDNSSTHYTVTVTAIDAKEIATFSFTAAANTALSSDLTTTISGTNITATVLFGTDITALVATFTVNGESVSVGGIVQESGTTANDFSSAVTYTVTAIDNSTQNYTVTITVTAIDDKEITAFGFNAAANSALSSDVTAIISGMDIAVTVTFGTDLTALVATFTTTGGLVRVNGTIQVSNTTTNDFSRTKTYTVEAPDGSTQDYAVTVTVVLNDAKELSAFSFTAAANTALSSDVTATISGTNITATVPYATAVTALVATFTTIGESITVDSTTQVSGTTANNFSSSVTYTVTAEDNSTQDYTITVVFPAGDSVINTVGSISFTMVYMPGGLAFRTGTGDIGAATVTDAYLIGQTEVTYELWYAVYTWAVLNGYTFANLGIEGHEGTAGAASTNQEPVTTINWRDAMVWMNALTEYVNALNGTSLEAAYTYNRAIIRDSSDSNATACDNAIASSTADGFRLLTSNEWELAARYINDANKDGDILDANEYYPGNYASGATADYNDTTATSLVAVYSVNSGSATAAVKSKSANALGLYDMSGNVWEWVFDLSGSYRVRRGGNWGNIAEFLRVGREYSYYSYNEINNIGFRLARSQ